MEDMIDFIKVNNIGEIKEDVSLTKLTTYKCGGNLKLLVMPEDVDKLVALLKKLKEDKIKYKILGKGSNVVFSNNEYDGVIIKLDKLKNCVIDKEEIICEAGHGLIDLAIKASNLGLTGMEFATGIPGTIGGAIFMNAGAYKSDMGYIVKEVTVLDDNLNVKVLSNKEMNFHYRTSFLKENPKYICLSVKIKLEKGNVKDIKNLIKDRLERRKSSQPLNLPSAGSVFRNHNEVPAGKLIENVGMKNVSIGGAIVSEKHANFILNNDKATGEDIKKLIELVQKKVFDEYNIELVLEQELVNF